MKKIFLFLVIVFLFISWHMFLDYAIPVTYYSLEQEQIEKIMNVFRISEMYAKAIVYGAKIYGHDPFLVATLYYTESNFRPNAVSPKGYVGIAQVPKGSSIRPVVNMIHGMDILYEKTKESRNNIQVALAKYKGGLNSLARKQGNYVLQLWAYRFR